MTRGPRLGLPRFRFGAAGPALTRVVAFRARLLIAPFVRMTSSSQGVALLPVFKEFLAPRIRRPDVVLCFFDGGRRGEQKGSNDETVRRGLRSDLLVVR